MLTNEENELLTRVGPGTPAGELLRRYWHPVAVAGELSEQKPVKRVKLLGEKLVVFRLPGEQPRYGLVAEQCRHRLASLAYGRVDAEGIRCPSTGSRPRRASKSTRAPAEALRHLRLGVHDDDEGADPPADEGAFADAMTEVSAPG